MSKTAYSMNNSKLRSRIAQKSSPRNITCLQQLATCLSTDLLHIIILGKHHVLCNINNYYDIIVIAG